MRFLLDMVISPLTAVFLPGLGYEVSHLHEEGLDRLPDPEILAKVLREDSVVLTHDLDFADPLAAAGAKLPSVVIFRLRSMRPANVNQHFQAILERHSQALQEGNSHQRRRRSISPAEPAPLRARHFGPESPRVTTYLENRTAGVRLSSRLVHLTLHKPHVAAGVS